MLVRNRSWMHLQLKKGRGFPKRHGLSKLRGPEKMSTMIEIQAEFETMDHSDLAGKAQSFVRQSLKHFMTCYKNCCGANAGTMMRDYSGVLRLSKFSCVHK